MLPVGVPAPVFSAPSPVNPRFAFGSLGGRYVLLLFLAEEPAARAPMIEEVRRAADLLRDQRLLAFGVLPDAESFAAAADESQGLRWFGDWTGEVRRLYQAVRPDGGVDPQWVLVDPGLRLLGSGPPETLAAGLANLRRLGPPDAHAGVPLVAPVLIVPRILEPALCRELIGVYEAQGGAPSGVMRQIEGRTVGVLDEFKRRRDAQIPPGPLQAAIRSRIAARLLPEIRRAFQFNPTRLERYIVACYDAAEGGWFQPHRDNTTPATAHRKFAVSINLNAEAFEGGDLRFPEFGTRLYRPPTGGAVVFSCSLLHEATPVTRGRRFATLPFLYDDAGEALRKAHLATGAAAGPSPAPDPDP